MTPKIGCCGFRTGMQSYFKNFKLVEIQNTFYKPPRIETIRKWRENAPKNFEFTIKAWQLLTHPPSSPTYRKAGIKPKDSGFFKPIKDVFDAWEKTKQVAQVLSTKIILFQCPASFKQTSENVENMKNFFSSISTNFIFTWEPRGKWDADVVKDICRELNLIHCVDPFKNKSVWGDFHYYRLHGIGGYRYKYTDEDLERRVGKVKRKAGKKK